MSNLNLLTFTRPVDFNIDIFIMLVGLKLLIIISPFKPPYRHSDGCYELPCSLSLRIVIAKIGVNLPVLKIFLSS